MEPPQALFTSEASLTFVDRLPPAEEIKNLQIVFWFCYVFSHDLSFKHTMASLF